MGVIGFEYYSPSLMKRIPKAAYSVMNLRYRGRITLSEYMRRMRLLGFSPGEALILMGEYTRAEIRIRPVTTPQELIGDEDETGYTLFYAPRIREYLAEYPAPPPYVRVAVGRDKWLVVIYVGSIKTGGGHEPIDVEVRCLTYVTGMDRRDVDAVEKRLDEVTISVTMSEWGSDLASRLVKKGIAYNRRGVFETALRRLAKKPKRKVPKKAEKPPRRRRVKLSIDGIEEPRHLAEAIEYEPEYPLAYLMYERKGRYPAIRKLEFMVNLETGVHTRL